MNRLRSSVGDRAPQNYHQESCLWDSECDTIRVMKAKRRNEGEEQYNGYKKDHHPAGDSGQR